jgi:hypothetical protein
MQPRAASPTFEISQTLLYSVELFDHQLSRNSKMDTTENDIKAYVKYSNIPTPNPPKNINILIFLVHLLPE